MRLADAVLERATRGEPRVAAGYDSADEHWTPEDDARLLLLRHERLWTFKTIARVMGRTVNCCTVRCHQLTKATKAH